MKPRRLISFSLLFAATALAWSLAPLLLPACLLWERGAGPRTRYLLLLLLVLAGEVMGLGAAFFVWLMGGGLAANYRIQAWWTGGLFGLACRLLRLQVSVEGMECLPEGPFLLLVRHTSWTDTVLAAALVANPKGRRLRYVLKKELLWDPCLDVVGSRLPNVFVDRQSQDRQGELEALRALSQGLGKGDGLLIYPEGTRFTADKQKAALAHMEARQSPFLERARGLRRVLPPRPAGVLTLLESGPPMDVLVLAHTGLEGSLPRVGGCLRVRLTRVAAEDVPAENRESWLYDLWEELDEWVSSVGGQ